MSSRRTRECPARRTDAPRLVVQREIVCIVEGGHGHAGDVLHRHWPRAANVCVGRLGHGRSFSTMQAIPPLDYGEEDEVHPWE